MVFPLHKNIGILIRKTIALLVFNLLFQRLMKNEKLTGMINQHFNVYLSAFRPGYGCQSTLPRITEDWKQALDDNK